MINSTFFTTNFDVKLTSATSETFACDSADMSISEAIACDSVTSNPGDVFINARDSATSNSADACDSATSDSTNISISEFINIFTSAAGIFNLDDADDLGGNFSARALNFDVGTALDFSLEFEFGVLAGSLTTSIKFICKIL